MTHRRNDRSPFNNVFVVNVTSNWLINVEWVDPQWKYNLNRKAGAKMWPICSLNESIVKSFE